MTGKGEAASKARRISRACRDRDREEDGFTDKKTRLWEETMTPGWPGATLGAG